MKNNEHLDNLLPIVREKLNLSNEDRKEFILEEKWITYPNAKEILDKLEFLYKHPKKSRMPCMLIVGETNNGKTSIINKFCSLRSFAFESFTIFFILVFCRLTIFSIIS